MGRNAKVTMESNLVWAKLKGFPQWPGLVITPTPELLKIQPKHSSKCIFFFGTKSFSWIGIKNIKPYQQFKNQLTKTSASFAFLEAVSRIEEYISDPVTYKTNAEPLKLEPTNNAKKLNKLREPRADEDNEVMHHDGQEETIASTLPAKTSARKRPAAKKTAQNNNKKLKSVIVKKNGKDADPKNNTAATTTTSKRKQYADSTTVLNVEPPSPRSNIPAAQVIDRPLVPTHPKSAEIEPVRNTLHMKITTPSALKIGFLGLGIMGSGIVKNLINSGHKVVVWNRTSHKCCKFEVVGAEVALNPSDVFNKVDITFSCVSDPSAAKEIVFGNHGILASEAITAGKGYVEMTGLDDNTSHEIADAIMSKGGRYLEAKIQGSKIAAEEGVLTILAAGEQSLFDDCQTCFMAMSKYSFFLGDVGNASKMYVVLQLMSGIAIAGLAECMALANCAGLQQQDVLEIFESTNMASPMLIEKGNAIVTADYTTNHPLLHMQKDLNLALMLSETIGLPLPLTATANEIYKYAKHSGYSKHDSSAVYIRTRI